MRNNLLPCFLIASALTTSNALAQSSPAPSTPSAPAPINTPSDPLPARPAYASGARTQSDPAPQTAPPSIAEPLPQKQSSAPSYAAYIPGEAAPDNLGSVYIPVDSWVYPAVSRLYSMGYLDTLFLGMRPWTRRSLLRSLLDSQAAILASDNEEAQDILERLLNEFSAEVPENNIDRGLVYGLHSLYTRFTGIGGPVLRDSYHLGQTFSNDYGRPYETGFNNVTGFSVLNQAGRFSLYFRGEYQHAPAGTGYSNNLASLLSIGEEIAYTPPNAPQDTIPAGSLPAQNQFRIIEGYASVHLLGHEISGGKSDAWLGPAAGGAMAWSNNAENMYGFRINRVEPLYIPGISKVLGPMRYDFFLGSLKGHSDPNNPYAHSDMFSFRPTQNFEFGFQRTVIFGGAGHEPVTLHTFLKGFFSVSDTTPGLKYSRDDPGARFSDFSFSYRLPFVRNYATFYVDSECHDDVTPISAPRRAAFRSGLYISQFPRPLRKLDFRVEAVSTDPPTGRSNGGTFNYFEIVQLQGYTNKGIIMGDWIGREAKGGQVWLTYHLSGNEWIQFAYLNKKTPKDFIAGGTTQNQYKFSLVKRLGQQVELSTWLQYEGWKAPIYKTGLQQNVAGAFQFTWYPKLRTFPSRP